jgi:thiamine biosynthesis protein ThiS
MKSLIIKNDLKKENKQKTLKETNFILNGQNYKIFSKKKITLYHCIFFWGYKSNLIAIEYNGIIMEESKWKNCFLKNNCKIEIVTIVGGG